MALGPSMQKKALAELKLNTEGAEDVFDLYTSMVTIVGPDVAAMLTLAITLKQASRSSRKLGSQTIG